MINLTNAVFEDKEFQNAIASLKKQKGVAATDFHQILRILGALQDDGKLYFEAKKMLVEKYGKKEENGTYMVQRKDLSEEDWETFNADLKGLLEKDVEIDLAPLIHSNKFDMDVGDIFALRELIRLPDDKEKKGKGPKKKK